MYSNRITKNIKQENSSLAWLIMLRCVLQTVDRWRMRTAFLELQLMHKLCPPVDMSFLLDTIAECTSDAFTSTTRVKRVSGAAADKTPPTMASTENVSGERRTCASYRNCDSYSCCVICFLQESVWLLAPLVSKLPSSVQSKVLKVAAEKIRSGNNFWTANSALEMEQCIQERSCIAHKFRATSLLE